MPDETDMAVTRGEMRAELGLWSSKIIDELAARLEAFGAEMRSLVKTSESTILARVEAMFDPYRNTPERLKDLERHDLVARVDALDEAQLQERVSRLEAKVFAPKRRATAARRKRS